MIFLTYEILCHTIHFTFDNNCLVHVAGRQGFIILLTTDDIPSISDRFLRSLIIIHQHFFFHFPRTVSASRSEVVDSSSDDRKAIILPPLLECWLLVKLCISFEDFGEISVHVDGTFRNDEPTLSTERTRQLTKIS